MAEERELLRYELDIQDVEAKAARLRQLSEQARAADEQAFRDWRAQEQARQAFERDLDEAQFKAWRGSRTPRERADEEFADLIRLLPAYAEVRGARDAAGRSTRDLLRHKRELANVVSLLGGTFGTEASQLTNVISLMATLGWEAAVAVAILSTVSGVGIP